MSDNFEKKENENAVLIPRSIGDLKYRFCVPSYQRGYRWESQQVEQLLDDIAESPENAPYYLQPIVVAPFPEQNSNSQETMYDYDLIDGQQRLTTIFLILQALTEAKNPNDVKLSQLFEEKNFKEITNLTRLVSTLEKIEDTKADFEIGYTTRISSGNFLHDIITIDENDPRIVETPDHLYMWHAYRTIKSWLNKHEVGEIEKVAKALKTRVRVIWYQLPDTVTDWKKFADLNIGKIPLTNSELVKALFLRSTNFTDESEKENDEYEKQILVAQWDQIERELSDTKFWGFLTKEDPNQYPTKIDLLFDLIARKTKANTDDKLYTFNYFVKWFREHTELTGKKKWEEIYLLYQKLRDWYEDRSIYHYLGYLVAIDFPENALLKVFKYAHPDHPKRSFRTTDRVENMLKILICKSLMIPNNDKFKEVKTFKDLRYNISEEPDAKMDSSHHYMIKRYLTLYNIMVTESASDTLRYPFFHHNTVKGGWSLEHIHAQKSEVLNKSWQWQQWITNHRKSLDRLGAMLSPNQNCEMEKSIQGLLDKMDNFTDKSTRDDFNEIAESYRNIMDNLPGANGLYQDEMSNIALLGKHDNSTLNNSTFDVKRQEIIQMLGTNYVPIATERVFLKAISGEFKEEKYQCDTEHMFFWGTDDREAYLKDMEAKLEKFIKI